MLTIDEVNELLNDIMDELPLAIFDKLNGGVIVSPEVKLHPEGKDRHDLYILGEYNRDPGLGRYIVIYYGSYMELYGYLEADALKDRLRETLFHELTHHLEGLAGERDLEIKDEIDLARYRRSRGIEK